MRLANSFAEAAPLAVEMGIGRHERGVEGAFGEDRPEMIGQPQRDEKRVGHRTRAENRREHDVARETGQPRKKRIAADGEDTSEHQPLLQDRRAMQNAEISAKRHHAQP